MAKITDDSRYNWVNLTPAEKLLQTKTGFTMSWIVQFVNSSVVAGMLEICNDYLKLKKEHGTIS